MGLRKWDWRGPASDSLVWVHQIRTISARRLSLPFGALEVELLRKQVATALRTWLDLRPGS